jgi:Tol biopolymer transport system component
MNTSNADLSNNASAPRRWRRRSLAASALVIAACLAWWLWAGSATVTAQMPAPPATSQPATAPDVTAAQPITSTLDAPGGALPPRPSAPAAIAATPAAAPTPAASTASSGGISAVAEMRGAQVQPLDGSAATVLAPGARLTLVGRSADGQWLLAAGDTASGWVQVDAVIAFNTARLPVTDAAPPVLAAPAATTTALRVGEAAAVDDVALAEAPAFAATPAPTAATGAVSSAAAAPATARLDTAKTRGLNVRAGPGVGYARLATLAADDVVAVVGRSADGGWLQLTLDAGARGWASAYYLLVDGDIDSLPVTAPMTTADTTADKTVDTTANVDAEDAAASSATPISQSPNPPISNAGTLAFQSGQGGAIYAYDLDSGDLRRLTTGFDPAISPDGQTVAFTRQGSNGGLYLIDSDGGNERRIYTGPLNMASPKWSEDGASIVFSYAVSSMECRDMGGGRCVPDEEFLTGRYSDLDANDYPLITQYEYDLGVVAADGSNFHSLSALPSSRAPDWGAAGIVYQSSDGLQTIQDASGAGSQVVTYDMLQPAYQDPDWQPGNGRIVFQKQGASHWQIWAVDPNGGNMVALTQPQTVLVDALPSSVAPAWSRDGSRIVFLSNREADGEAGAWRLWVMGADGSNQRPLPIEVELNYTFGAEQMVSWGG